MALFNQPTHYSEDVTAFNRQIDSEAAESANYYNGIINAEYAHQQANAKLLSELGPFLGDAGKFIKTQRAINEAIEDDKIFELTDEEFNIRYKGDEWEAKEQVSNSIKAEEQTAGTEVLNTNSDPMLAKQLLLGDQGRGNNKRMLVSLANEYPMWLAHAGANYEITANGRTFTRDTAGSYEEYMYATKAIRRMWFEQAVGTEDNPTSLYDRRKYLHQAMRQAEANAATKWTKAQTDAIETNAKLRRQDDLKIDVNLRGGIAVEEHINTYVGALGGYRNARQETFNEMGDMAEVGQISYEKVEAIGEHYILGRDGNYHQIKKYWKEDFEKLKQKSVNYLVGKYDSENNKEKADILAYTLNTLKNLDNQEGPVTEGQLDDIVDDFKERWPGRQVPNRVKNYYTIQDEQDDAIEKRLFRRWRNQEQLTTADIQGITDQAIYEKWRGRVKASSMEGLSSADVARRDTRIRTQVIEYTKENHGLTGKTPRFEANIENATVFFNDAYKGYIKAHPDNPGDAFKKAWEDTKNEINSGAFNKYDKYVTPSKDETALQLSRTLDEVAKNPSLINTTVLSGTEDALKQGVIKIETGRGDIPGVYRLIANRMKPNEYGARPSPYQVMATQVALAQAQDGEKVSKIEPAKVDEDVKNQVKPEDQKLLSNKTSQARTNRVIQNAETLDFLLDSSKRYEDYDNILSPTGGDAHLDKPLTEHTIEEVVQLLESGHTVPGAYGFSPTELLEALQATGMSGDRVYDEVTQDLLTLSLYKSHINRQYRGGFYTELVDLTPSEQEKAETIAENIPPFNRSENLLKALHGYGGNVAVTQ